MASPTSLEAPAEEMQKQITGPATPLEQVQCNVLGCDEWLPRQDLPAHLADHFSGMAKELARLRRAVEEKDERLDDLERERACLEEEVRLVKQEGATQIRQLADQSQQEIEKCQDTLAQTQGDLQQAQHSLELTRQELTQTRNSVNVIEQTLENSRQVLDQTGSDVESTQHDLEETQQETRRCQQDLIQTQEDLEQTRGDLQQNRHNLEQTQGDLRQTRHNLEQTQGELRQTQHNLEQTQEDLQQTRHNLEQTQGDMRQTEQVLNRTRNKMQQMNRFQWSVIVLIGAFMMAALLVSQNSNNYVSPVLPVRITMASFQAHKEANDSWFSEPFYTHPHGYKVCLVVQAAGTVESSTGYVSVGIRLMRGEFDDNLDWPFHGIFTIQLLDNKGSYHTRVLDYPDRQGGRVTTEEMDDDGGNITQFVFHNGLKSYLQDNSLQFRVSRFEQNHTAVILQEVATVKTKQQEMFELIRGVVPVNKTMDEFLGWKESGKKWYSEPFYTHPHGYKVRLVVQAAGTGENSTGYVSVGIRLMRGEFDDNLDWPFHGNFTIQLLDKKGSSHTHVLDYPDRQGGRVTTEEMADGGGNITQFVSHNDLKSYLQDNSLQFRVSRFEQNHTAVILQEVATVKKNQREMFELIRGVVPVNKTMDEFLGWKESGKKWYSEPFYTHPHGYKVCLVVQAAGTGESSTGYVSVGIRLMRGEFDDNLDWPFHGNFDIQLLDSKGSSHTRVLDYPDRLGGRVTTGEMADDGGIITQFVSHNDLKSYLQDNSLQFRVSRFEQNHTAVILQEVAKIKRIQHTMSKKTRAYVVCTYT